MNKQPKRTAATKQSIIDAFWVLAKVQGIHSVTISAVTKQAGLNRGTFYVYFEDIIDLQRQAEEAIVKCLREQMQLALSDGIPADFQTVSEKAVRILSKYGEKLFILLGQDGDPGFIALFRSEVADMFQAVFKADESLPDPYREHIIVYLTSGFIGLFTHWYENGKLLSIEELAGISFKFASGGLSNLSSNLQFL